MNTGPSPRRIYAWDLAHQIRPGSEGPLIVKADESVNIPPSLGLEGAVSLREFNEMRKAVSKDREIVFYSHSVDDQPAKERAAECAAGGFSRVAVLVGGINAWIAITPFLAARRSAAGAGER